MYSAGLQPTPKPDTPRGVGGVENAQPHAHPHQSTPGGVANLLRKKALVAVAGVRAAVAAVAGRRPLGAGQPLRPVAGAGALRPVPAGGGAVAVGVRAGTGPGCRGGRTEAPKDGKKEHKLVCKYKTV